MGTEKTTEGYPVHPFPKAELLILEWVSHLSSSGWAKPAEFLNSFILSLVLWLMINSTWNISQLPMQDRIIKHTSLQPGNWQSLQ